MWQFANLRVGLEMWHTQAGTNGIRAGRGFLNQKLRFRFFKN